METSESNFDEPERYLVGTLLMIQAVVSFLLAGVLSIFVLLFGPITFSQVTKNWWTMTLLFAVGPYIVSVLMGIAAVLMLRRKRRVLIFIFLSLYILLYLGFVYMVHTGHWTGLALLALLPILPPVGGVIIAVRFKKRQDRIV